MKKIITILVAIIMVFGSLSVCFADGADATAEAYTLNKLGLFNGTGTDEAGNPVFSLENKLSRQEATALLVRLLGKEEEAKSLVSDTPFTDVDEWAKPYIGYAYNQGLVNGIGESSFGSANPISATEYLTLILRALGHDDKQGDFSWNAAWILSDSLGMTSGQYNDSTNSEFFRNDAALISYMSLMQKIKSEEQTLGNKLLSAGAFSEEQLKSTNDSELIKSAGVSPEPEVPKTGNQVAPVTGVTFMQRGVYVKMTLVEPADKTGIVGYEALIYNRDIPDSGVHRTIAFDNGTAHYRIDDTETFMLDYDYNTIKVISNAADGYDSAEWISDISVVPVQKDITIAEAYVENEDITLKLNDVENGYMGFVFTRQDESVVDDETFFDYTKTKTSKYYSKFKEWSDEDKRALENGEIFVSITGMYIIEMTDADGNLKVQFERIKSPKIKVKCDADIIQ